MNPERDDLVGEEISVRWLIKSLVSGIADTLRRNKLATMLAAVTLTTLIALAVSSQSAGITHYQEVILPRLLRLEGALHNSLRTAERASDQAWRLYYFENAHSQVRDILRAAQLARPESHAARTKHREFVRYYQLIDSEFHTIGARLKTTPDMDYLQSLTARMEELKPIRDTWAEWISLK